MCLSLSKTHQRENQNSSLLSLSGCLRKTRNSLRLCKWKSACLSVCMSMCLCWTLTLIKDNREQIHRGIEKESGNDKSFISSCSCFIKVCCVFVCSLPPCDAEMHVAFLQRKQYIFYGVMNFCSTPRIHTNTHIGFNNASYLRLHTQSFQEAKGFLLNGLGFWGLFFFLFFSKTARTVENCTILIGQLRNSAA